MAHLVLLPCKFREGRIVPQKGSDPLTLDWAALVDRFAASRSLSALQNLRLARPGWYLGLMKKGAQTANFLTGSEDRSGKVEWLLKRVPDLPERLIEVYRIEEVQWDSGIEESGTPEVKG